jgi:hypothetical protein
MTLVRLLEGCGASSVPQNLEQVSLPLSKEARQELAKIIRCPVDKIGGSEIVTAVVKCHELTNGTSPTTVVLKQFPFEGTNNYPALLACYNFTTPLIDDLALTGRATISASAGSSSTSTSLVLLTTSDLPLVMKVDNTYLKPLLNDN